MTPLIATFLAGSLLSLLMPTILLTVLVVWYVRFIRRAPDSAKDAESAPPVDLPSGPTDDSPPLIER